MIDLKKNTGKSRAGYHRLEDLTVCPRRFGYREIEHLVPIVSPKPLALGTCVHEALAAFYLGRDPMAALRDVPHRAAYCVPQAKPIVSAYLKSHARERLDVLAVEEEVAIKLHGRLFTRRLDLVVAEQGRVVVRDHKTSGDSKKRAMSFPFDASLFTQEVVGKPVLPAKYQLPWGGVQVNIIETREPFRSFVQPISWMPLLLKEAPEDLAYWTQQAAEWVEKGVSGWKFPKSWHCQGQYSQCDYLPLCLRGDVELGAFTTEKGA